jgi:hypothetical protein
MIPRIARANDDTSTILPLSVGAQNRPVIVTGASGQLSGAIRPTGHPTALPPEESCDGEAVEDGDYRSDSFVATWPALDTLLQAV